MRVLSAFWPLIILLVLGGGLLLVYHIDYQNRYDSFQRQCVEQSGHIYNPGGVSFCISDDGRFIEVYP